MSVNRHQHRQWALQVLYGLDIKNSLKQKDAIIECENIKKRNDLRGDGLYFQRLVKGVIEEREKIDNFINDKAIDWKIDRMACIDRNILRIARYEIKKEIVPVGVAINEAVELAKEYGDDKSSSFINGILAKT
ncbi:MAG: transcription antitermination factor NusB [Bacillota bacterium]